MELLTRALAQEKGGAQGGEMKTGKGREPAFYMTMGSSSFDPNDLRMANSTFVEINQ